GREVDHCGAERQACAPGRCSQGAGDDLLQERAVADRVAEVDEGKLGPRCEQRLHHEGGVETLVPYPGPAAERSAHRQSAAEAAGEALDQAGADEAAERLTDGDRPTGLAVSVGEQTERGGRVTVGAGDGPAGAAEAGAGDRVPVGEQPTARHGLDVVYPRVAARLPAVAPYDQGVVPAHGQVDLVGGASEASGHLVPAGGWRGGGAGRGRRGRAPRGRGRGMAWRGTAGRRARRAKSREGDGCDQGCREPEVAHDERTFRAVVAWCVTEPGRVVRPLGGTLSSAGCTTVPSWAGGAADAPAVWWCHQASSGSGPSVRSRCGRQPRSLRAGCAGRRADPALGRSLGLGGRGGYRRRSK